MLQDLRHVPVVTSTRARSSDVSHLFPFLFNSMNLRVVPYIRAISDWRQYRMSTTINLKLTSSDQRIYLGIMIELDYIQHMYPIPLSGIKKMMQIFSEHIAELFGLNFRRLGRIDDPKTWPLNRGLLWTIEGSLTLEVPTPLNVFKSFTIFDIERCSSIKNTAAVPSRASSSVRRRCIESGSLKSRSPAVAFTDRHRVCPADFQPAPHCQRPASRCVSSAVPLSHRPSRPKSRRLPQSSRAFDPNKRRVPLTRNPTRAAAPRAPAYPSRARVRASRAQLLYRAEPRFPSAASPSRVGSCSSSRAAKPSLALFHLIFVRTSLLGKHTCLAVRTRRVNLQPIRVVLAWVSFRITIYLGLCGPTGCQSSMDIDMTRVTRRGPRIPIVLVLPPGSLQTSMSKVLLRDTEDQIFVPTGAHVARVRERARDWVEAEIGAKPSWRATRSDRGEP
uniref:Uncharacterized protein n=1 Tax=Cucumis melo TaxID=3656 RepID=A0A9I9E5F6_CUCME